MSIVNISIANKKYQIGCENGQEERLLSLSKMVDARAFQILDKIGPMPESQMLVTLCVVMADEISNNEDIAEILERVREIKRVLNEK